MGRKGEDISQTYMSKGKSSEVILACRGGAWCWSCARWSGLIGLGDVDAYTGGRCDAVRLVLIEFERLGDIGSAA